MNNYHYLQTNCSSLYDETVKISNTLRSEIKNQTDRVKLKKMEKELKIIEGLSKYLLLVIKYE